MIADDPAGLGYGRASLHNLHPLLEAIDAVNPHYAYNREDSKLDVQILTTGVWKEWLPTRIFLHSHGKPDAVEFINVGNLTHPPDWWNAGEHMDVVVSVPNWLLDVNLDGAADYRIVLGAERVDAFGGHASGVYYQPGCDYAIVPVPAPNFAPVAVIAILATGLRRRPSSRC